MKAGLRRATPWVAPLVLCVAGWAQFPGERGGPESALNRQVTQLDLEGKGVEARRLLQQAIDAAASPAAKANLERAMAISWAFEGNCALTTAYEQLAIDYWATQEQADPHAAFYQEGERADEAARVCIDAGDLDTAAARYKKGHDLGLKEPDISADRKALWEYRWEHAQARLAARRGDKAEAERHVAAAKAALESMTQLRAQQESFFPYLTGYVAFYLGDYHAALADLLKANTRDPFIQCLLGETYEKLGERDKAMEYYRMASTARAHNPPAAYAVPFARKKLAGAAEAGSIVVDAAASHAVNSFSPPRTLGGAIDRLRGGPTKEDNVTHTERLLTNPVLKELLGAGWGTVTYRQNTELMIEAWHWNPHGTWSNEAKKEGYFTGSAEPTSEQIRHSWAYPLPHRGATLGDGNGWSRLTDGNLQSYWKSNPYLTKPYTGDDDALHPQWVMVDLGAKVDVNAIRIAWADPYATRYYVQFWTGEEEPFYDGINKGAWQTFPMGTITHGRGGTPTIKLVSWKIPVRYLRIWMLESSNTCDTHGSEDRRNCLGYAIKELYIGTLAAGGQFTDVVKHMPNRQQTITWPSSVDPWHSAADLDYGRGDQIGFDFFFHCGVTRGLPAMIPIAILYNTPEDAANEIAYLYKRGYPISHIEMGEEPDGQRVLPEDYATLYVQFAKAIHKLVPKAPLGGPAFEGTPGDVDSWADANGQVSFLGRFLDYLKARGRLRDFTFFSFEHYPCLEGTECVDWRSLYWEPEYVDHLVQAWKDNGLPRNVPFYMTEGNDLGEGQPGTVKSALWLADYVGSMLTAGASGTYYFHYIGTLGEGGGGFLPLDREGHVRSYSPQYIATQVITKEWVEPVDAIHKLFKVSSDVKDPDGHILVTAYAVERPDGQWSVMLVNKDRDHGHDVTVRFADPVTGHDRFFSGPVERVVFGAAQYQWHPDPGQASAGERRRHWWGNGHADPDGPPARSAVAGGGQGTVYDLPKASIVVLRGRLTE